MDKVVTLAPLYEALADQYAAMAEAASTNDWERLTQLELEARSMRKRIETAPAGAPYADRERVAALITRILELDAAVRVHVEPYLESIRKLLAETMRSNSVRKAYGAFGP